jgi:integrase/recombinase XerD
MSGITIVTPASPLFDEARLAVAGFLARYSGPTRRSYATDLRQFFSWCASVELKIFELKRGHIELWARSMEDRGLSRATIGRRLSTVGGFYRICVIDGLIAHSPAEYVRRPKIDTESPTLGLDRMELSAFVAQAAAAGPWSMLWRVCSDCSGCGCQKPAPSTSRTSPSNADIGPSPSSARGPNWR